MISKKPLALAVAIPLLLAGLPARADTLHVASDTMTNPASPNQKNGTNSDLIVRNTLRRRPRLAVHFVGTTNARLSHVTALGDGGSLQTWGI